MGIPDTAAISGVAPMKAPDTRGSMPNLSIYKSIVPIMSVNTIIHNVVNENARMSVTFTIHKG